MNDIWRAAGVLAVAVALAGCGPSGGKTAAKQSHPATATATAAAGSATPSATPVGAGADCGVVGGGVTARLVVTEGHISCQAALAVMRKYMTMHGQGSGDFVSFDGWSCARNSVAGAEQTGTQGGCERDDKTAAFQLRGTVDGATPGSGQATTGSGSGSGSGSGKGRVCYPFGGSTLRVNGSISCIQAYTIVDLFLNRMMVGNPQSDVDGWSCTGSKPPPYIVHCSKGGQTISVD